MTQFALLCISLSPDPPVSLPVSYRPAVISDDEARPDLVTMARVAPEMVMIFQQR